MSSRPFCLSGRLTVVILVAQKKATDADLKKKMIEEAKKKDEEKEKEKQKEKEAEEKKLEEVCILFYVKMQKGVL